MQESIEVALHGIYHDERFLNEFREYTTEEQIRVALLFERDMMEMITGKNVKTYIPPHNTIDRKTVNALVKCEFERLFVGPETDVDVIAYAVSKGMSVVRHSPPYLYGRSDELLQRGAPSFYRTAFTGLIINVGLHWTWEHNVGLQHLDRFLSEIEDLI
jgi:hypothetical protein